MKKWIIVCGYLICFLILYGCSSHVAGDNAQKEVGTQMNELIYEDHYLISMHYPKMDIEALDAKIMDTLHAYQDDFLSEAAKYKEEDKAEFNVTYQSYLKEERYISVKLEIFRSLYEQSTKIETIVYDLDHEEMIDLYDIYDSEHMQELSDYTRAYFQENFPDECSTNQFRIATSPMMSNYSRFVLRKDAIVFYFPQGTLFDLSASMEVSYDDISSFTKLKKEELTPVFVPYDQVLNEPIKHIDPDKPMVALTFDDGPTQKYTTAILDALKEHHANATFFVLGSNAEKQPQLLQRMVLEGNEIGNHTYSHKQLTTLSKENIEEELNHTQECIYGITGRIPEVIRPPYGSKNETVLQCAQNKKLVTWTIDTEDWKSKNAKTIVDRVLHQVKDGDIILMHDMYAASAEAAVILISELQERGFQLVTVSELYHYGKNDAGKIM